MKLASLNDGSRDGQLAVVSRDLKTAVFVPGFTRLQQALDDWDFAAPQLQELAERLAAGRAPDAFAFEPERCMAPLPRAYRWAAGGAYLHHEELLSRAAAAEPPRTLATEPRLRARVADRLSGACDPIAVHGPVDALDFEAGLAVITDDVPPGCDADAALEHARLVVLVDDVGVRAPGAGGEPWVRALGAAFSPVALTPDELGGAWRGGRLHLELRVRRDGAQVGRIDAGAEMSFHFGQLIAQAAGTRGLVAGTVVGTGAVSSREHGRGYACIAERRAHESLEHGEPRTAWLGRGETVRVEMLDAAGASVFGAIEHGVEDAR